MILRSTNRKSKPRKRNSRNNRLNFEVLEDRKLMAADLAGPLVQMDHLGHQEIVQGQQQTAETPEVMAAHNCNHHHNPAMALVTDAQATHTVIGSGNWSDPSIWQNGVLPGQGARIIISEGQTVTVDGVYNQEFKTIRVDGTLRFATNINTQIKVDTLVSTGCARLEMGTQNNPIQSNVSAKIIFADDGAIDRNWDPARISRGAILAGTTVVYGAETTDRLVAATQPRAGATQVQLSAVPTNWDVGDQIVITGTQGATSDEVRTITSINGSTVGFNQALQLDHVTPKDNLNVYVVNKTRNVEFRSENTAVKRRGHIMFMHTHNVDVNYAGFYDLGRTDKSKDLDDVFFEFAEDQPGNRNGAPVHYTIELEAQAENIRGRYAVHFHRGGVDPSSTPATVVGSVVDGSPGWGFVNHSSHVNFSHNVAYGVWGSAYYTEAGNEIGSFDNNIAIRSVNPRDPVDPDSLEIATDLGHVNQEFGNSGDGFWLSGHLVSLTNNVSSGASGHGIIIWSDGLVEHDLGENSGRTTVKTANIANGNLITGRDEIPVWWAPMAEISNNEASGGVIGLRTRYIHANGYLGEGGSPFHALPDQAYIDTLNPVIDGLKSWGNREGVMLNYSERLSLKNAEIVGIGTTYRYQDGTTNVGVGLDMANSISRGSARLENISIEGFEMGFMPPRQDQWTMDNFVLKNTTDMLIEETRLGPRTFTMSNFEFGSLNGTAVEGTAGQRRNIVYRNVEFSDSHGQPYWFMMPDRITLDGQGLYSRFQDANFIPLTEAPDENPLETIPQSYIGKTNQQLRNLTGLSYGAAITPTNAQTVDWLTGGKLGTAAPASMVFPTMYDMTGGGEEPGPPQGGPVPEFTGNRMEIRNGETLVLMNTNFNTTDTNTGWGELTYSLFNVQNGFFAHRDNLSAPITSFTQAEVNGGVIRFVHDGNGQAPDYRATVTDGTTTTAVSVPIIVFDGNDNQQTQEIGYSGVANAVNHQWQTITLPTSFNNPVVITGASSRNGANMGVVRLRNVTSNSFQIRFQEWNHLDGLHTNESIGYLVVEAGTYELTDGTKIMAGTTTAQHENFANVNFQESFTSTPVVLGQIMTYNGNAPVTDRIKSVTNRGFQIQMQEEEAENHFHLTETIGWVAIDQGTATSGGTTLNALVANNVNHNRKLVAFGEVGATNPVVLSDMQTRNGSDTASLRHPGIAQRAVYVMVEEEQSRDTEMFHINESVGILAFSPGTLVAKAFNSRMPSFVQEEAPAQPGQAFDQFFSDFGQNQNEGATNTFDRLHQESKDKLSIKSMPLAGSQVIAPLSLNQPHDDSVQNQNRSQQSEKTNEFDLELIDQVFGDEA